MISSRRERLKQELRDEILDAARKLFVKEGYESVGMRKIAEAVGCSPGTLYLYFADKTAILSAICVETFAILGRRMAAIARDPADPMEALRRCGRTYVQFGLDHPHHYVLTFGPSEHPKDEQAEAAGTTCFNGLRASVRACVEAGETNSTDVEELAQAIWAIGHGIIMMLISKPDFPFIEHTRLIERTLDMVIEGIRKR